MPYLETAIGEEAVMMTDSQPRTREDAEYAAIADSIYRYARRYAVNHADGPEAAMAFDAAIYVLNRLGGPTWTDHAAATAVADRHILRGPEKTEFSFFLPSTVEQAVVLLHRYARRFTNGRGTFTAAFVNAAARELQRLNADLDETRAVDGTIWAADGVEGQHDGLSAEERAEALAAIRR